VETTHGHEVAISHEGHAHAKAAAPRTVEKGHVYFFYRPKVELSDSTSLDEVQKLYLVLAPFVNEGETVHDRLIVIPKKRMPSTSSHERHWGFVDKVAPNMTGISQKMGPSSYPTMRSGMHHLAGTKPCGFGVYNIVHHHEGPKEHAHFAYVLELPEKPGKLQRDFNIAQEASYLMLAKNPNGGSTRAGFEEHANYPKPLLNEFHGNRWTPLFDSKLLDYEGAQILFIGAAQAKEVTKELGECARDIEVTAEEEEAQEHEHPGCILDPSLFSKMALDKANLDEIIPHEWPTHSTHH
jgi:hypothetical protein